jgi:hypothetical protein
MPGKSAYSWQGPQYPFCDIRERRADKPDITFRFFWREILMEIFTGSGDFGPRELLVEPQHHHGPVHARKPSTSCQSLSRSSCTRYSQTESTDGIYICERLARVTAPDRSGKPRRVRAAAIEAACWAA